MAQEISDSTKSPSTVSGETVAKWAAGFAGISALVGIVSAGVSWRQARIAANVARRQSLFQLNDRWSSVNEIVPSALIGPDVRAAVNALELTASCWHHDVVEKGIVIQTYWPEFQKLYDTIIRCDAPVPGYGSRQCKSFISSEVRKAYLAMKEASAKGVPLTSKIETL